MLAVFELYLCHFLGRPGCAQTPLVEPNQLRSWGTEEMLRCTLYGNKEYAFLLACFFAEPFWSVIRHVTPKLVTLHNTSLACNVGCFGHM